MMFSGRYGVMKLVEFTFDITWKGNSDCAVLEVPCHRETKLLGTGPFSGDLLLNAKHGQEVVGVFL